MNQTPQPSSSLTHNRTRLPRAEDYHWNYNVGKPNLHFCQWGMGTPQTPSNTIRALLAHDDYPSVACRLPPIDTHQTVNSMESDVASVREAVAALLAEGKSVICVAHSYGGTVLTEAIGTLVQSSGLIGKNDARVRRLVYVSAMAPQLGETQMDVGKGAPSEPPPVHHRLVGFRNALILSCCSISHSLSSSSFLFQGSLPNDSIRIS